MSGMDGTREWTRPATEAELDALTNDEIEAAVAADPDAAPIRTEDELAVLRSRELERDTYGVLRLCRQPAHSEE